MFTYVLASMLGTFLMIDFGPNTDRNDIQEWEIECEGKIHIIEHWQEPDPVLDCQVIKMILEAEGDLFPILDDNKKYKP